MRAKIILGAVLVFAIGIWITSGRADDPKKDDGMPTQGALRIVPKEGAKDSKDIVEMPLKHTDVSAEIAGFVSRVKVTQTFVNPCKDPIEAIYVFPLPANAAVGDMQIRIGDRLIKGVIQKREEARKTYEEARAAGKTAALLEQERPNIFTQSVANVLPGNDIRVEITYDEVLKYEKGVYEFSFPMVVGPRYIPGEAIGKQAGGWAPDTTQVPDASRITPPVLKPGERSGHDISLSVTLTSPIPIHRIQSPSHEVRIQHGVDEYGGYARRRIWEKISGKDEMKPMAGDFIVSIDPRDKIPNKDFVLRYTVAGEKPQMGLLDYVDPTLGGYFLLMFQPPEAAKPDAVTPKEMVFVLDTSGSMSGEPIALSKKAMRNALKNLNPDDTFQIIRFSESASPFANAPLPNTPANIERALSYLNGLQGEGGTEMIEGIKAALNYPTQDGRLRIVCFMTDGYIGNESEILAEIEKRIGDNTRLFSFGVGSSVNHYLLDNMAEIGRGAVQYVLLNEKPDEAVEQFYERVRNPIVTNIHIDWAGLDVHELYPSRIPDLFAGQPIFVLGRYEKGGNATVKIHAQVSGKDATYEVQADMPNSREMARPVGAKASNNAALAPLWARVRIKALSSEQFKGEDPDVVKAITEVALKYRLMSEYTSFVAVEEKVVTEDGTAKTIQVPVEMPEGVSYEGVFGSEKGNMPRAMSMQAMPGMMPGMMPGNASSAKGGAFFSRKKSVAAAPVILGEAEQAPMPSAAATLSVSEAKGDVKIANTLEDKVQTTPTQTSELKPFAIEYAITADGAEKVVRIEPSGEIWVEKIDPATNKATERVLAGRLSHSEMREVWSAFTRVMNEKPGEVTWSKKGKLMLRVLDRNGKTVKEATVKCVTQGGTPSKACEALLALVEKFAKL